MDRELYFEDLSEGKTITPLTKGPINSRQLVMFASSTAEYPEIHYDRQVALAVDLPDIIIQGWYKTATLAEMLTNWIGLQGRLRKITVQHRGMDVAGNTLLAQGRVTGLSSRDGENRVDCEIWIDNQHGQRTVIGSAVVTLPARD